LSESSNERQKILGGRARNVSDGRGKKVQRVPEGPFTGETGEPIEEGGIR